MKILNKYDLKIIHDIIFHTMKIIPKDWDMNFQKFNCDCHGELTNKTYISISKKFNISIEESIDIVDRFFIHMDSKYENSLIGNNKSKT